MTNIYQLIENIRIRATTIANQYCIPDSILRQETESAGNDILELAERIKDEIPDQRLAILSEIGTLQDSYEKLKANMKISKQDVIDLVVPFRDKYGITDAEALKITRNDATLSEMANILNKERPCG